MFDDVLDVSRIGTDVTSKITLTPGQSAFSWVLTANTIALSVMAALLPWYTQGSVCTVPLVVLCLLTFVIIPDALFLPFVMRNAARVEAAGFSRTEWMSSIVIATTVVGVMAWLPPWIFSTILDAEPRYTAEFCFKAIACAVATDVPFFFVHRALHRQWPKLHILHHLCTNPSLASGFIVDPIDVVSGFALPGGFMLCISLGLMRDPWVHIGATAIHTAWAIISHDSQAKLPHYYHHAHCDSRYALYVPLKTVHDPKDKVRAGVFKIRQQERDAAKKK